MRMRPLVGAALAICALSARSASDLPISSPSPRRAFSSDTSRVSVRRSSALRTDNSTRARSSGFSRKSKAPNFVARTASSMVAWPEIMIVGTAGARERASMPDWPGSFTSSSTASMPPPSSRASASSAEPASSTE